MSCSKEDTIQREVEVKVLAPARPTANTIVGIFNKFPKSSYYYVMVNKDNVEGNRIAQILRTEIIGYFYYYRNIDIRADLPNVEQVILLGLFYAKRQIELGNTPPIGSISQSNVQENMGCFITAVADIIGISQAKEIWQSIVAGATDRTIIGMVKFGARKVGTVFTVIAAVYQTAECLGMF